MDDIDVTNAELRTIVWEQLGIRVPLDTTREQMHDLLNYRLREADLSVNLINRMRNKIMEYIGKNHGKLSLPCHGRCYEHHDVVVLSCYRQLLEDTDGTERI